MKQDARGRWLDNDLHPSFASTQSHCVYPSLQFDTRSQQYRRGISCRTSQQIKSEIIANSEPVFSSRLQPALLSSCLCFLKAHKSCPSIATYRLSAWLGLARPGTPTQYSQLSLSMYLPLVDVLILSLLVTICVFCDFIVIIYNNDCRTTVGRLACQV